MHSVFDQMAIGVLGSLFSGKQINLHTAVIGALSLKKKKKEREIEFKRS